MLVEKDQQSLFGQAWLVVCITSLVLAACGPTTPRGSNASADAGTVGGDHVDTTVQAQSGPAQPLDDNAFVQFFWSDDETEDSRKFDEEFRACMANRGFESVMPVGGDSAAASPPAQRSTESGYGVVAGIGESDRDSSSANMMTPPEGMSAEEAMRYQQSSFECGDEANAALTVGNPRFDPVYEQVLDDYYSALNGDGEILALQQVWRECVQDRTNIQSGGAAGMEITRSNIDNAVEADLAARLGRTVRFITSAEADTIDDSQYEPPVDLTVDGLTKTGFLIYGPYRSDSESLADAADREVEIRAAAEECERSSGINDRILELQDEAMQRVAAIDAGNTDSGASDPATKDPATADTSG